MSTTANINPLAEVGTGSTPYSAISSGAANQDSALIKAGAVAMYGFALCNNVASARYVKFYNKATAPTSADTPAYRVALPASCPPAIASFPEGVTFPLGLGIRITTGAADSDTGACSANDVMANVNYATWPR
jgi:hypothetical protein